MALAISHNSFLTTFIAFLETFKAFSMRFDFLPLARFFYVCLKNVLFSSYMKKLLPYVQFIASHQCLLVVLLCMVFALFISAKATTQSSCLVLPPFLGRSFIVSSRKCILWIILHRKFGQSIKNEENAPYRALAML